MDIFVIASVLEGSTLIPSEEIICPKNTIEFFAKLTFILVKFQTTFSNFE